MTDTADENEEDNYYQLNDEQNTQIIKELAAKSTTTAVQKIILSYEAGKDGGIIRRRMNKFNLPQLQEAAELLKMNTVGVRKPQLVSNIIHKIESFLREKCDVCEQYYNLKLEDEPLFRCEHCQQGCHTECFQELANVMDKKKFHMFKYYCTKCLKNVEQETRHEPGVPPPPAEQLNSTRISTRDPDVSQQRDQESDDSEDSDEPRRICKFYIRGKCKFGSTGTRGGTCRFEHPEPCKPFSHHGATSRGCQDDRCTLWHPPLCRRSTNYRKCFRQDCHFWHLRGTIRRPPVAEGGFNPQQPAASSNPAVNNHQPPAANVYPAANPAWQQQPAAAQANQEVSHQNRVSAQIQLQLQSAEQKQNTFLEQMREEMNQMKIAFQQQMQTLIRVQPPQMNNQPQVNNQNQPAHSVYQVPVYNFTPSAPPM